MMKKFNEIKTLNEFDKDVKKLSKKYQTLKEDLDIFIDTALVIYHKLELDYDGIYAIPGLGFNYPIVYKAKKFACKALKGTASNSGIRVIYAYYPDKDIIELVEIYYKGVKANEDKRRIQKYYERS